jgi:hypothetical protein
MRRVLPILAVLALSAGAAQAQSVNKTDDPKQQSPGATGAMQNSTAPGVATDPNAVKAQQGDTSKSSPGTVGAAPGADAPSQKPQH